MRACSKSSGLVSSSGAALESVPTLPCPVPSASPVPCLLWGRLQLIGVQLGTLWALLPSSSSAAGKGKCWLFLSVIKSPLLGGLGKALLALEMSARWGWQGPAASPAPCHVGGARPCQQESQGKVQDRHTCVPRLCSFKIAASGRG